MNGGKYTLNRIDIPFSIFTRYLIGYLLMWVPPGVDFYSWIRIQLYLECDSRKYRDCLSETGVGVEERSY